jgi:hypothetical protein
MDVLTARPQDWRLRASELRAIAVKMKDPIATRITLHVAQSYDRMAERIEERLLTTK